MRFEDTSVYNIYNAILGARNPMNSWNKSDSVFKGYNGKIENTVIGENDLKLLQSLIKAGLEHRKFMRQIGVSVIITAPLYWWKEFDTYKVGTVSNSCSTMHTLSKEPITKSCFEMDDFQNFMSEYTLMHNEIDNEGIWFIFINYLEWLRQKYNETKEKKYWKELIRLLPESFMQKRTITMNYENILSMVKQRRNHKLIEWSVAFILWAKSLPYANKLIFIGEENGEC